MHRYPARDEHVRLSMLNRIRAVTPSCETAFAVHTIAHVLACELADLGL